MSPVSRFRGPPAVPWITKRPWQQKLLLQCRSADFRLRRSPSVPHLLYLVTIFQSFIQRRILISSSQYFNWFANLFPLSNSTKATNVQMYYYYNYNCCQLIVLIGRRQRITFRLVRLIFVHYLDKPYFQRLASTVVTVMKQWPWPSERVVSRPIRQP